MKNVLLFLTISLCLFTGCRWKRTSLSTAVFSPSGKYKAAAEVNFDRKDKTKYLCLKLHLSDAAAKQVTVIQTSASDTQKWALGWMPDEDIVVLYSADIGTRAYRPAAKGIFNSVEVTDEIIRRGKQLKEEKYRN